MVFIAFVGIGCGWVVGAFVQYENKMKTKQFDGKTQQPHILCLGLAKCDGVCGRMGIAYVFD